MRLLSTVLFAALLIAGISAPQVSAATCPSQPKTEAALLDLERSWAKALQQHDAARMSQDNRRPDILGVEHVLDREGVGAVARDQLGDAFKDLE